jgi:SAM-dependent methyltransferase
VKCQYFYYIFGLAVLILNRVRYFIRGYTSPRPFDISRTQQAIDYDISVVDHWLTFLSSYTKGTISIRDKTILVLGPGADLGVGLITLFLGAKQYNSLDVNNLVKNVPEAFYDELFSRIPKILDNAVETVATLKEQLSLTNAGKNDRLNYICRNDFDIKVFGKNSIDIVFSQAAIEHFDDIKHTFSQLSEVVKPGGIIVAEIDLNTHTRWLRDVDPLNIYRFPEWLYRALKFRGAPNRVRPDQYQDALASSGWESIYIKPLTQISTSYLQKCRSFLANQFNSDKAQMDYLTIMICAKKR